MRSKRCAVQNQGITLSSLTTSKERLQKFHTDDVSLPEIWIIKATSFPGSLSYLSLLSRTGRREPWERVNFPRGTSDQSKELLYRDLGIAPFSSAESLCVVGFLYFFFRLLLFLQEYPAGASAEERGITRHQYGISVLVSQTSLVVASRNVGSL